VPVGATGHRTAAAQGPSWTLDLPGHTQPNPAPHWTQGASRGRTRTAANIAASGPSGPWPSRSWSLVCCVLLSVVSFLLCWAARVSAVVSGRIGVIDMDMDFGLYKLRSCSGNVAAAN
jgi:hypothetical protein